MSRPPIFRILGVLSAVVLFALIAVSIAFWNTERPSWAAFENPFTFSQLEVEPPIVIPPPIEQDFEQIQARDTLVVLTTSNSTSYFLYRGQPMGYEYELLKRFAKKHDLILKMRLVDHPDSLFVLLNQGHGDVVANRVVPHPSDTAHVAFTESLYETQPVLVQQQLEPEAIATTEALDTLLSADAPLADAEAMQDDGDEYHAPVIMPFTSIPARARIIRDPADLAGERVTLSETSPYRPTLIELTDTLTGDIEVVELEGALSEETLIRKVSRGEVDFTVAPENLAALKQGYFSNIHIQPTLDKPHDVAWAVRSNASSLQNKLDTWIADNRRSALFNQLYEKYFIDRKGYRERITSTYLTNETGKLSAYDSLFQQHADTVGWDWRLLAAQAFQESRFNPKAKSWAGAKGLLQLMPPTAREFGVRQPYNPEDNVAGAARYLVWLQNYWENKIADEKERLKFILASYNAGPGHLQDARRLTEKYGDDPDQWEDVAYWLLQKSKRKYYTDPVVYYGFVRGLEPVTYVDRILDRYEHYQELVIG